MIQVYSYGDGLVCDESHFTVGMVLVIRGPVREGDIDRIEENILDEPPNVDDLPIAGGLDVAYYRRGAWWECQSESWVKVFEETEWVRYDPSFDVPNMWDCDISGILQDTAYDGCADTIDYGYAWWSERLGYAIYCAGGDPPDEPTVIYKPELVPPRVGDCNC